MDEVDGRMGRHPLREGCIKGYIVINNITVSLNNNYNHSSQDLSGLCRTSISQGLFLNVTEQTK
jgi:hypothetical protein